MSREGDYYKCSKRRPVLCREKATTASCTFETSQEKATIVIVFVLFEHRQSESC